jgi:hypothetical protein
MLLLLRVHLAAQHPLVPAHTIASQTRKTRATERGATALTVHCPCPIFKRCVVGENRGGENAGGTEETEKQL